MIQLKNKMIPIEVKAGKTGTLKSLQVIMHEKKLEKAIRFNADYPSKVKVNTSLKIKKSVKDVDFELISLPFYLVHEIARFL